MWKQYTAFYFCIDMGKVLALGPLAISRNVWDHDADADTDLLCQIKILLGESLLLTKSFFWQSYKLFDGAVPSNPQ